MEIGSINKKKTNAITRPRKEGKRKRGLLQRERRAAALERQRE